MPRRISSFEICEGPFPATHILNITKAAREEASNAGKQQIDLIDGEEFISKLIEYGLGVKERRIYEVDKDFFERV